MADTVYRIRVDWTADTSSAERGADRVSSGFRGVAAAVAAAGAALGVSRLAEKIFEIGKETEDLKISMAGMFQAFGAAGLTASADDFTKAMGMSGAIFEKMRVDARELPGELEDLTNIFRMAIGGGMNAGKSVNEIEQLSSKLMAFGAIEMLPSQQTAREFAMMMEGRAGAHNVLFQRLRTQIGMTAKEFNALSEPAKWNIIERALKGYDPAIKEFGKSWSAISSTTVDIVKNLIRIGGAPVFEMVKRHLSDWNDWFEKNQQYVDRMATEWGEKLASGIETAYGWAKSLVDVIVNNRETLLKIAEAYVAFKGVSAFGGGGKGIGGTASNMLGGAGMGVAISAMFGNITETGGTLNATMMAFEGVLSRLPGTLGAVSTALLIFHGALQAAADEVDKGHKIDIEKDTETARLMRAYKAYELNEKRDNSFQYTDARLAFQIAKEKRLFKSDGSLDEGRLFSYATMVTKLDDAGYRAAREMFRAAAKFHPENNTPFGPAMPTPEQLALNRSMPARNTNVNITNNNHIVQTIEQANDPDRVLVKTREALESIYRHPQVNPFNRFATVR
jgi:hypothetical protein